MTSLRRRVILECLAWLWAPLMKYWRRRRREVRGASLVLPPSEIHAPSHLSYPHSQICLEHLTSQLQVCVTKLLLNVSLSFPHSWGRTMGWEGKGLRYPHDLGISRSPGTRLAGWDCIGSCWIFPSRVYKINACAGLWECCGSEGLLQHLQLEQRVFMDRSAHYQ